MEPTIRTRGGRRLVTHLPALLGLSIFVVGGCGDDTEARLEVTAQGADRAQVQAREVTATTASASFTPEAGVATTATPESDPASSLPVPAASSGTPTTSMGIDTPVSYEVAEAAYTQARFDEATQLFASYTTRRPENAWGHYMLGLSAWKAGTLDQAELALEETVRLDPDHVKGWINLGRVLLDRGRTEEATEKVNRALELAPESADGLRVLGRALHGSGDVDGALSAYRRAIVTDETDAWSMNNLGLLLIQSGRYEEALGPLVVATRLSDDVAVFQNNLGVALERTGHPTLASEAYGRALDLEESYERARTSLERVASRAGDRTDETLDLGTVARLFAQEVGEWRTTFAPEEPDDAPPSVPGPDDAAVRSVEESVQGAETSSVDRLGDDTSDPSEADVTLPEGSGTAPEVETPETTPPVPSPR